MPAKLPQFLPTDYVIEDRGYETPCWAWRFGLNQDGYAQITRGRLKGQMAHRAYWEDANGPIPLGHELDHLCRQRDCVNPAHGEPVTRAENIRRSGRLELQSQVARRWWASLSPEERSAIQKEKWAKRSSAERTDIAARVWRTRRERGTDVWA